MTQAQFYLFSVILIVINALIAYTGARRGAKVQLRKYYQEKWWDRRAQTYERIMTSLYGYLRYSSEFRTIIKESYRAIKTLRQQNPDATQEEMEKVVFADKNWDNMDTHIETFLSHKMEIQKEVDIGAFIISDEVSELLKTFLESQGDKHSFLEYREDNQMDEFEEAIRKCIEAFRILAKKDLGVHKSYFD